MGCAKEGSRSVKRPGSHCGEKVLSVLQLGKAEGEEVAATSSLLVDAAMVEEGEIDYPEEGCQDHCRELIIIGTIVMYMYFSSNP